MSTTERQFDAIYNEGGEGFNPVRDRMPAPAPEATAEQKREREDRLRRAMALEFGGVATTPVAAPKARVEWTREETVERRAAWNAAIQAAAKGGKVDDRALRQIERTLGYNLAEIKRAKALHGIA